MKFKENLLVVLVGINLFKTNVLKSHILGIVLCMVDMTMNKYKDQEFGKQLYKQINPVDNRIEVLKEHRGHIKEGIINQSD